MGCLTNRRGSIPRLNPTNPMTYKIQIIAPSGVATATQYLSGPRTPDHVRKSGYGFTADLTAAWPFPSAAQAFAKLRIVDRHMGGSLKMGVVQ